MPSRILNSDQLEAVRSDYYSGKGFLAFVSNRVIFQAEVATVPTGNVFGAVAFTNVTTGAYSDIREGMAVIVSTTLTNYTTAPATDRYRVRKPPTSGILYISEASDSLPIGTKITVLNTYDLREKAQTKDGVDFDKPFHKTGAVFTEIDSAYGGVTLEETFVLNLAPVAVPMAAGDSVASYAWEFDVTPTGYTVGSSATRVIEVELPVAAEWGRCVATTASGVATWFAFSLHFGDPENDPRFLLCHEPVSIEAAVDTGYSASTTAFANYEAVMDRTRCAVIVQETYGPFPDPGLGTVRFVGYTSKDTNTTSGSEQGPKKSSQIEIDGFKTLAGLISIFPIAIRNVTPPLAWGDISNPTTERVIAHLLLEYSTLANLCAVVFPGFTATPTKWAGGNFDITDTSLMDAAHSTGMEINGDLVCDAAGGFVFERHGSFISTAERNALPTVTPEALNSGDELELVLERQHRPRVGKVEMGARVFFSNGGPSIGYTALAPAVAYGEGQERVTIPAALLPADDLTNAAANASLRAAYWYAFKNNSIVLSAQLTGGYGCMSPSNAQWWPFDVAARDTTRGIVITSATRWLLQSVRTVINANGVQDVSPNWIPETMPGRSMILVARSPSVSETAQPVMPTRSAYGAFPPAPSINYTSTNPTNKLRRDPFSGWQTAPWPSKQAAEAALKQGTPGCSVMAVSFRNPSNVATGFLTTLGEDYTIHLSGSAKISNGSTEYDFTTGENGWEALPGGGFGPQAVYHAGEGYARGDPVLTQLIRIQTPHSGTVTSITLTFNISLSANLTLGLYGFADFPGTFIGAGSGNIWTFTGFSKSGGLVIQIETPFPFSIPGTVRLAGVSLGEASGEPLYADSFYQWNQDEAGNPINVALLSGGLRLDNSAVAVPPPFSSNHEYDILFEGTGNTIAVRFEDTDYSDNQSVLLYLKICGPGAGQ